jgi:hypothetical protein
MNVLLLSFLSVFSVQVLASDNTWNCKLGIGTTFEIKEAGPKTLFTLNKNILNCPIQSIFNTGVNKTYSCMAGNEKINIAELTFNDDAKNQATLVFSNPNERKANGKFETYGGSCEKNNYQVPQSAPPQPEPCFLYINPPDGTEYYFEFDNSSSSTPTAAMTGDNYPGDMIPLTSTPTYYGKNLYTSHREGINVILSSTRINGVRYLSLQVDGKTKFEKEACASTQPQFIDGELP